jgi:hypothetical protein
MKYSEMVKFLNNNGIDAIQPIIASEVNAQLEKNITDDEFENVCHKIYGAYLDCDEEPDMWYLVDEELTERGYKNSFDFLDDLRLEQMEQM